ncbi:hypothetical protein [Phenylobacterium sp.]|jgi:hypothetical protein|uniref:hypothetical protein n=1 Tax=Phenylobacterium sp. TaxID=1871053 RepID=UPI002F406DE2
MWDRPARILAAIALAVSAAVSPVGAPGALAAAQTAAETQPSSVEGVTVVAPRAEQRKLPALVERFVEAHAATGRIDQLSRWATPVCPVAGGLSPPFNDYVVRRVRSVAAAAGAPVEKHPNRNFACKTNLLIVFTTKPQALLDDVRKRHPQLLGFHYAAQAGRLAVFDHPIQAWYMTGTKAEGGVIEADDEFTRLPSGAAGSHFSARLESQFMGVLVVVDSGKILGHQIGPIADSVAMLSLARLDRVQGCSALPTIVDFLNPDCPPGPDPSGLSQYDAAFLKGLYATDAEQFGRVQRSAIGSRMLHDLESAPAPPKDR